MHTLHSMRAMKIFGHALIENKYYEEQQQQIIIAMLEMMLLIHTDFNCAIDLSNCY